MKRNVIQSLIYKATFAFLTFVVILTLCKKSVGQAMVVSSYFNASDARDEWTELLVIQDNLDVRNWTIGDNNANQDSWQPRITFRNDPFWQSLRAGTIIVLWHRPVNSAGVARPEDLDLSDGFIQLRVNNSLFSGGDIGVAPTWSGGTSMNLASSGDLLQLRDATNSHVHALGHRTTPGSNFTAIPGPKLNHAETISDNEIVMVVPGNNIAQYGTSIPQNGTFWTARSAVNITQGLPNTSATHPNNNSIYWRSLRQPSWPAPNGNFTVNGSDRPVLTWDPIPDPVTSDGTTGYLILRNTVDDFSVPPADGTFYANGDLIGTATVVNASLAWSYTTTWTDNSITVPTNGLYYRVYPFRFASDNINGNNYNTARGRAYNETEYAAMHVFLPVPTISNSVNGSINEIFFQMNTPSTSYQVNAINLSEDLIITASTSSSYPEDCQIQISLSPEEGYTNQIQLTPINGMIDTTIYVKPGCEVVPFTCWGSITHSSVGAQADEISVYLQNEYWYQYAPIVEIADVQAIPGDTIDIPFTSITNFDVSGARFSIDYNPSVISFIGVVNAPGDILVCNNCINRFSCSPIPYTDCQINTLATISDPTQSTLQINLYYSEVWYGGVIIPAGEKFFDIQFLYHGGYSDLTFTDGDYNFSNNGIGLPLILNEPFEDYYHNGSVGSFPKTVNLELNLEGLYIPSLGQMNKAYGREFPGTIADEITVGLASSTFPYTIVFVKDSVLLDQNGNCQLIIPGNLNGEYYIVITHRNSIETWSKFPVSFSQDTIAYNFTDLKSRAYNDNLKLKGDKYCIYAADVNQDGFVDTGDMSILDNESNQFATGYNASDANGDGTTDSGDIVMADNNSYTFTTAYRPFSSDPSVITSSISEISHASAISGGEVISQGSSPVTSRGICWNTSPNPTISNSFTIDGTGAGNFVSTMSNLLPNTNYYVRAYVTNTETTVYGYQLIFTTNPTFATISTDEAIDITETSATSGGNITSNGGIPVTQRGVCWSILPNPTIADFKTIDGSGSGSFLSNVTGLLPNTLYYLRAYAINNIGAAYGNEVSFTTIAFLPQLTTATPSDITATTAVTGGMVTTDGGATVVQRGVCYGTEPLPTTSNDTILSGSGTGSFTGTLTGLIPYTTYYIRAFATNIAGTAYGNEISFTTLAELPTLTTATASNITGTSAISGGNITSDGGAPVTQRGVCWSGNPNPTLTDQFTNDGSGSGDFNSSLSGLILNHTYYVRAYAINSAGTTYGNEVSFTTALFIPGNGVADIDGNSYSTVILGNQEWMGENLKVSRYSNGEAIAQALSGTEWSSLSSGGWCWMNNNNQYENPYGKLYNYYAVTDRRNLCPTGWHVPTDAEWTVLSDYLGGSASAGGKMKETGTLHWNAPNTGATNASSFTGVAGGYRTNDGTFSNFGNHGIWWSSTEMNSNFSWYRSLFYNTISVNRGNNQKKYGFSVRCVKVLTLPTITTAEVTGIDQTTAISGGNIIDEGSLPVLQRGVCWNTTTTPTTADFKTFNGSGLGSFVSNISGLSAGTTYFVRAFAISNTGTAYGNEISFTTDWSCGSSLTINHTIGIIAPVSKTTTYGTVSGISGEPTKCWITSNLGADRQATAVNDATDVSAGWYWQFNKKQGYKHDGAIRSPNTTWISSIIEDTDWQTANDPCTLELGVGWRIPTATEWTNLDSEGGWTDWNGPWNSSLKLHAAGYLNYNNGSLSDRGIQGFFWSSSQHNPDFGWFLSQNIEGCGNDYNSKAYGLTLRCVKNNLTLPTLSTTEATGITDSSAVSGGTIIDAGSLPVLQRGVCWSTSQNPTISDRHSSDGSGSGSFISNIDELNPATTYYVRAYITNVYGTFYGNEIYLTTIITSLCGNYTIGGPNPDFQTFSDAVSALNTNGISCPVVFKIRNGTYNDQIEIIPIPGSSSVNTVTFESESGDSSQVTINCSLNAEFGSTIVLNGSNNIVFNKIGITRLAPAYNFPVGILISNQSSNISFTNCYIAGDQCTVIYVSEGSTNILFRSNFIQGLGGAFNWSYSNLDIQTSGIVTIENNIIKNASKNGIQYSGASPNLKILGNTLTNNINTAIYLNHQSSSVLLVSQNLISNSEQGIIANGNGTIKIIGNRIFNATQKGIEISSYNKTIMNNYIQVAGINPISGIVLNTALNSIICHNNVSAIGTNAFSRAIEVLSGGGLTIYNNIFSNSGSGYASYIVSLPTVTNWNNNNYYSQTGNIGFLNEMDYITLTSWGDAIGGESSGKNVNPFYTSFTELKPNQIILNGTGIPLVNIQYDIDSTVRNPNFPDIGAKEFSPCSIDAGINIVSSPVSPAIPGTQEVKVILQNQGTTPLASVTINWKVNGIIQAPFNWSGTLPNSQNVEITIGTITILPAIAYQIEAWTSNPGNLYDCNYNNDTITSANIYSKLCGTYYIGGTDSNFQTFSQAVEFLNNAGIDCPVIFKIRNGTYFEQIEIRNIDGSSVINTVTFESESGDSSQVTINCSLTAEYGSTIFFNGSNNLIFNKLGIIRMAPAYSFPKGILISNQSSNISFNHCYIGGGQCTVIHVSEGSNDISFESNYIQGLGGANWWFYSNLDVQTSGSVIIKNNIINDASENGIQYNGGSANLIISGNNLSNNRNTAINLNHNSSVTALIEKNNITNSQIGINSTGSGKVLIDGNQITTFTSSGVSFSSPNSTLTNNFIYNISNLAVEGFTLNNLTNSIVAFNSIYLQGNNDSSKSLSISGGEGWVIKNNILSNFSGGYSSYIQSIPASALWDFNDYYSNSNKIGYLNALTYNSLTNWASAIGGETNGKNLNPFFASDSSYIVYQCELNGAGIPIPGILFDIEGHERDTETPDIGAFEFMPCTSK